VRQNIEQVLFVAPGERVFRPHFGAGVRQLTFEPAGPGLEELTRNRLRSSLAEALEGEVDARTLEIDVEADGPQLRVGIAYELTTIGRREHHEYDLGEGSIG
jgi:phage baseplate assembly protein W